MGTGASRSPVVGVPVNPRVNYADVKSKQSQKPILIDAPALVKVNNGTLRYRLIEDEEDPKDRTERIEKPHEGPERAKKHGYFFHAGLNDFSENANYMKEDEASFRYVYKGPQRAQQKKVFYVYGIGWDYKAKAPKQKFNAYQQGPSLLRLPNHVYYELVFIPQDEELPEGEENDDVEDMTEEEVADISSRSIELKITDKDRVQNVRRRMSVRLLKPFGQIHVFLRAEELRPEDVVGDHRKVTDGSWKRFAVLLKPF